MELREKIAREIEDKFLPLDYGNWQPDELLEQILSIIRDPKHVIGNDPILREDK